MNKEHIKFLKNFKEELLTQETYGQATPRFWVIRQQEKNYWVTENVNGIFIFDNGNCESLFEGEFASDEMAEWFLDYVKEKTGEEPTNMENFYDLTFEFKNEKFFIMDIDELGDFLTEYCYEDISIGEYRDNYVIKENTLFLTEREAKEHLEANYYHYNDTAHVFAMTAWRSPQLKNLLEIIEEIEWDKLLEEKI